MQIGRYFTEKIFLSLGIQKTNTWIHFQKYVVLTFDEEIEMVNQFFSHWDKKSGLFDNSGQICIYLVCILTSKICKLMQSLFEVNLDFLRKFLWLRKHFATPTHPPCKQT